jgi:hypothetical protein
MKLPPIISKATLKGLAKPDETHIVRVIAHEANNGTAYRLRCRSREYRFERDGIVGKHILDIPVSLWMAGAPTGGRFRDNQSIAEDFRTAERCPYSVHVIPIGSTAAVQAESPVPALRKLLSGLGAPASVRDAFAIIEAGGSVSELHGYVDSVLAAHEKPKTEGETPAQARARKMREAKSAKKKANLQPA